MTEAVRFIFWLALLGLATLLLGYIMGEVRKPAEAIIKGR